MTKKETAAATTEKSAPDSDARELPLFKDDYLPEPPYGRFRKKVLTRATRIDGPFRVRTPEGELECPDGWLALDESGAPYPISAAEFEKLYESADDHLIDDARGAHVLVIDDERYEAEQFAFKVRHLAEDFARAILRNPAAERYLYGIPIDGHRIGNDTVGQYLAYWCDQLAADYVRAADAEHAKRMPPPRDASPEDQDDGANSAA